MSETIDIQSDKTMLRRIEQYKDRWSSYEGNVGIRSISQKLSPKKLRQYDCFKDYDDQFLEKISPDISVAEWSKNAVLFEEGAYIDLAFFLVDGEVETFQHSLNDSHHEAAPIFDPLRTIVMSRDTLSSGLSKDLEKASQPASPKKHKGNAIHLLSSNVDFPKGAGSMLSHGEIFGEIGAMSGWPQSVTARTSSNCTLVQIRVAALRAMKRKSSALKNWIDKLYRSRFLVAQLKVTPMLQNCDAKFINTLKEQVELVSAGPGDVIAKEGGAVDAIYLVRSGFVKLLQKFSEGDIVVSYLSKGMSFGEAELLLDDITGWEMTAVSVEYAELIKIPKQHFSALLDQRPDIEECLWKTAVDRIREAGYSRRNISSSAFTQLALTRGLVQANSLLVMDLETCTRCDDCVRACAATHSGRPRFVREGDKVDNLLIPKSCYHCQDPVCMVGCPTGAIQRGGIGALVEINDQICIGCGACANNCPYDSIVMHTTGQTWPNDMLPSVLRGKSQKVASKCNLCHDTGHEPACVINCPQGSASRVNSIEGFQALLSKPANGTTASTPKNKTESPLLKAGFFLGMISSVVVFIVNLMVSQVRPNNIWGFSYGAAATLLLVGAALLGARRRTMKLSTRLRLGRAVTWRTFHLYSGILFFLLMLMHVGFKLPTGVLNASVWWVSLIVFLSGLLGWALQKWMPRVLSSGLSTEIHHGRVQELVDEIRERAEKYLSKCQDPVKSFYEKKVLPELQRPQARFVYFFDITGGLQSKLREFDYLKTLLGGEEKDKLQALLQLYKSKLKIDAHYTLQRPLRWWLYAHLPISMLLIVLVFIHILAVSYY